MRSVALWSVPMAAALLALTAAPAAAQLSFDEAVVAIDTSDPAQIQSAIESFGLAGEARAVAPLMARARRGLPPALLEQVLDTLAVLGQPDAGPLLFEMLSHRRPSVRLRAVQAIATCHPRGADRALMSSLSDSSADVRATAATTLGDLGATAALDSLFLAFDRSVPEAGMAIAHIARPEDMTRVLALVEHVPFSQMGPILAEMLTRTNLAERSRIEIVARLGELASAEARTLLETFAQSRPARDPVRRAAEAAAARIAQ
jgi:HEAT repeat protein